MDDERLDWGNDDEDQPIASALDHHAYDADPQADDGEDAVSLGDEDDGPDHSYFTPSKLHQRLESPREEAPGDGYLTSLEDDADRRVQEDGSPRAHQSSPRFSPSRRRGQPTALTHALPPKPQWDPATMDSLIAVTYAPKPVSMTTTRSNKQRPNGANPNSADSTEPLPQDWEAKQSRNEDGKTYYYNSRTRERTWERPFATTAGEPSSPAWSNDRHGRDGWSARQRDGSPRGSDHHNVLSNGRESGGAQDSYPQDSYQASRSFEERPHRSFGHSHSRRHDFSPQDEVQDSRGRARAPDRLPPQAAGLPSAADSSARGFSDRDGPYGQSGSRHGRASHRDDPSRIVPQKDRLPAQGYGAPDFSNNQYPGDSFSRERPRRPDAAPERGRRLSTSFPPSSASQDALVQDHYIGRSSTLRHRSPPPRSSDRSRHYERGYSPPPPDASSTVQPSRTRRAASPAGGRPTGASHRPAYEQPDVLPQRRPAPDYDDDYDSSKRRRVEGSGSDSALARRPPADTGSHSFRESAMVPISTADHPRSRRRIPLPPQQERFREIHEPKNPPPPGPENVPVGPPPRLTNAQPGDVPYTMQDTEAPRRTTDLLVKDERLSSNSRGRFSNARPSYAEEPEREGRDVMDIDPSPSRPPPPEPVYSQAQFYARSSKEEPRDRDTDKGPRPNDFHPPAPSGMASSPVYGMPPGPLPDASPRLPPSPKSYRGDHRQPPEPPMARMHPRPLHQSPVMDRRPLRDEPPPRMMRYNEIDSMPPSSTRESRVDHKYAPDLQSQGPAPMVSGPNSVPVNVRKPNPPHVPQGHFPPPPVERRPYPNDPRQNEPPYDYSHREPARRIFDEPRPRLPDRSEDHGAPFRRGMVSQQGPPEMTHRPDVPRQDNNGGQSFRRNSRFGPPIDTQVEAMPPNDRSRPYMSQGPEAKFNNRPPTPPHLPPSSALRSNYKGGPPDRPPDRRDHPAPRGGRLGQGHMGVYNAPREMDRSGFPMRRRSPSPVPAIGEAFEEFEKGAIDRYPQRGYDRQRESYARDGRHDIRQAFPNSEVRQQQRWDRFPIPEREPSPPRPAPMNIPPAISTSPKVQQLTAPAPPLLSTSMPAPVTETEPALVPRASQPVRIRRPPRTESFVERERASDEQIAGRVETMGIHDAWGDRAGSRRTLMDRIADNGNGSGMMPRGATLRDRLGGVDSGREHGNGNRDGYGSRNGSVGDEGEGEGEGEEGGLMRNGDGKGRPKKKQKGRRY